MEKMKVRELSKENIHVVSQKIFIHLLKIIYNLSTAIIIMSDDLLTAFHCS